MCFISPSPTLKKSFLPEGEGGYSLQYTYTLNNLLTNYSRTIYQLFNKLINTSVYQQIYNIYTKV